MIKINSEYCFFNLDCECCRFDKVCRKCYQSFRKMSCCGLHVCLKKALHSDIEFPKCATCCNKMGYHCQCDHHDCACKLQRLDYPWYEMG